MKITDIECIHLRLPEIKAQCDGTQDTLVVRVHTDTDLFGIGEVDSSPHVAKAVIEAPMSHTICCGLRELVVGENPLAIEDIWRKMYWGSRYMGRRGVVIHAMSAIDIALWDIAGKAHGKPVYELLGGKGFDRIRAYASMLMGATPEITYEKAKKAVARGFTAVKFGWDPLGQSEELDLALVAAARRGVGEKVALMIDAGQCYDVKTARRRCRQFQEYNLTWLEEPLHPDDFAGYGELSRSVEMRIAAGEAEDTRGSYQALMDTGGIDVVQVDVTRCGGLSEARKIADLARDRHKPVVNHSFKTGINMAASLHFLAGTGNNWFLEYGQEPSPLREELTHQTFPVVDGYVALPQEPGLGITLNEATVEAYRER